MVLRAYPSANMMKVETLFDTMHIIPAACFHFAFRIINKILRHFPNRIRIFVLARLTDMSDYFFEFSQILLVFMALVIAFLEDPKGVTGQIKNIREIKNPRLDFGAELDKWFPRLRGWWIFFTSLWSSVMEKYVEYSSVGLAKVVKEGVDSLVTPFFTRTPSEATKLYKYNERACRQRPGIPTGYVQIHFYSCLESGKYKNLNKVEPDMSIDLPIEKPDGGIDLLKAKSAFGIESLEIITNAEPFRTVFIPVNENRLSRLAGYTLSKEYTEPIRVFEPRVSKISGVARAVRKPAYPVLYFLFTTIKCLLGFPEKDRRFFEFCYGRIPANIYRFVGIITTRIRSSAWFLTTCIFWLIFNLSIAIPCIIAYKSTKHTYEWVSLVVVTAFKFVGVCMHTLFALRKTTWVSMMVAGWCLYIMALSLRATFMEYMVDGVNFITSPTSMLSLDFQTWFITGLGGYILFWLTQEFDDNF